MEPASQPVNATTREVSNLATALQGNYLKKKVLVKTIIMIAFRK